MRIQAATVIVSFVLLSILAYCTYSYAVPRIRSGGGGGSGGSGTVDDDVTVNSTAVDTTANLKDTATVTWAVVDGGAGGPDDAQATAVDLTCTNCIGDTEITTHAGTSLAADLEEEVTEGSLADNTIVTADIKDGEVGAGA